MLEVHQADAVAQITGIIRLTVETDEEKNDKK
jgi:hypothetical protein